MSRPSTRSDPDDREGQLSLLRNGALLALGAGHGAVDLCANVLPIFYPMLVATLGLSYGSVGALTTVQSTASSLGQPFFGWLSDRFGSRLLAPLSVLGAGVAVALVGFAPSYFALVAVVAVLGLSVGAWHPQGAKVATLLGGKWRTTSLSVYMVGGNAGYSSGPLLAAAILVPAGLTSSAYLLIPCLLAAFWLLSVGRRMDRMASAGSRGVRGVAATPIAWLGVSALAVVIAVRAWATYGMVAFLPLLYSARGEGATTSGEMLFFLLMMEGAGTVVGGWLADRFGKRLLLSVSFLLMAPAIHLFVGATGPLALLLGGSVGLLLGLSATITLVAAQEILPTRMGVASGLAISLSNIMGGMGVGVQGLVADQYGLLASMGLLVAASLVAAVTSLWVGDRRRG